MAKKSRRVRQRENVHYLLDDNSQLLEPIAQPRRKYVKNVRPRSEGQQRLMEAIDAHTLVIGMGPAGTGKTYLSVAAAVQALDRQEVERIVLSRPAVEAGEQLGFLKGGLKEKLDPYMRPLYDALLDRMGGKRLQNCLAQGVIEIAPLAFMRGRTLANAFIILDEAQNTTAAQIKMFLTRLGDGSRMVVTGDPDQTDLAAGQSGLGEVAEKLDGVDGISVTRLYHGDVVRHPLVSRILERI